MDKTLYAIYMVSPVNAALSQNLKQHAKACYDWPATLFTSESSALQFITGKSKNTSARATTTPIGEKGTHFLDMPGIGLMTTVTCPENTWEYIKATEFRTAYAGVAYTGFVSNFDIQKEEAVFERSELHPFKKVPLQQGTQEFLARWANFQELDQTLQNTTPMNRNALSWDAIPTESLRLVYGRGGLVEAWRKCEDAMPPQDARFEELMNTMWGQGCGMQYMAMASKLYAAYRDSYARSIVNDIPPADAQIKAAIVAANRAIQLAENTNDFGMVDRLQHYGEDLILELNGRYETTRD